MALPKVSEAEFVRIWGEERHPERVAERLGMTVRGVQKRRKRIQEKGHHLPTLSANPALPARYQDTGWTFPREERLSVDTGSVVIFSDAHYWPGEPSAAHRALLHVIRDVKPRVVIANGDIFDGGSLSRHPPFGWNERPSPIDELHTCQERLGDIEQAIPNGCGLYWNVGNHDVRWERTLATDAEKFAGLRGLRLADHFPAWEFQWSTPINTEMAHPVMVKHRYAAGIHAGYNNTLKGGWTMVTGHTHQLECKPYVDYRGRRWGIQCGTLADLDAAQFEYMENAPSLHCSGFAVLTFRDGNLLPPELCEVLDGVAHWRGDVLE